MPINIYSQLNMIYGVVIQCDKDKNIRELRSVTFLIRNKEDSQYKFLLQYLDGKRVYNVINNYRRKS